MNGGYFWAILLAGAVLDGLLYDGGSMRWWLFAGMWFELGIGITVTIAQQRRG